MAKFERIRDVLTGPMSSEYFNRRTEAGWKLIGIECQAEWQREVADDAPAATGTAPPKFVEEVPYGLRVGDDSIHLEENPAEMAVLVMMMDLIVQDKRLSAVADELNRNGFRTRDGREWSAPSVFNMVPRLVEVGPRIFSTEEWAARKPHGVLARG